MEATEGHLLGGRVRYAQPRTGFRSGIEPVLLAAAIPARPGDRVLEAGCGAGASLLCLSARIPGVNCVGIERDAELVALSTANATANGWMGMTFLADDIEALPPLGLFDHACANPPYHHAAGTTSPSLARDAAKRAVPGLVAHWVTILARMVCPGGTLTIIVSAARLPEALGGFDRTDCAAATLLPLWPKPGRAAKLILLQGTKGARSQFQVLAGLTLHAPDGKFTRETEAVLRDGGRLALERQSQK